jgi:hypothetical protein
MFAAGLITLWRCRRRSRKATAVAIAGLCGLAGLWLFVQLFLVFSKTWQEGLSPNEILKFSTLFSFVYVCWNSACVLLLVVAVVIDRRSPIQSLPDRSGPAADFADFDMSNRSI